ncbi:MAG: tetraacyldisaccharide 4'-kinase [Proteobacteria bacterium]|nr:tetraacyldisaccharide 4'-kinase [Pseudomonadota bacterium]
MRLSTPRWWYVRDNAPMRVTRLVLTPLSWIWAWETARRLARGNPVDPGAPVICVGNVTMGGTGKTPVVRAIGRRLAERGRETAVLSRGHGGRLRGPLRVDPARHSAADVGDEPLMLAADQTAWIARDRAEGARAAVAGGAQVILMDDGFQSPAVRKALSILVVDGETRRDEWPFGDGAVFPAGPMREPLAAGLARADAVVLLLPADLPEADPELVRQFGAVPVLTAHLEPLSPPLPGPQLAFAGIGKPWKMERALVAAGCELVDFAPFPDHARIPEGVLRFLARRAAEHGAGLLTSEKDWVRLSPEWRRRVTPWPVQVRFDDEQALDDLLASIGL